MGANPCVISVSKQVHCAVGGSCSVPKSKGSKYDRGQKSWIARIIWSHFASFRNANRSATSAQTPTHRTSAMFCRFTSSLC